MPVSCHKSPAVGEVGCDADEFAPPAGSNCVPSYTFNCPVFASNHNSPLIGAVGVDVDDAVVWNDLICYQWSLIFFAQL